METPGNFKLTQKTLSNCALIPIYKEKQLVLTIYLTAKKQVPSTILMEGTCFLLASHLSI